MARAVDAVEIEQDAQQVIIHFRGLLYAGHVKVVREHLQEAASRGMPRYVLDFSRVTTLSFRIAEEIVRFIKHVQRQGAVVESCGMSELVRESVRAYARRGNLHLLMGLPEAST